jgi:hypothetical protein
VEFWWLCWCLVVYVVPFKLSQSSFVPKAVSCFSGGDGDEEEENSSAYDDDDYYYYRHCSPDLDVAVETSFGEFQTLF